MTKEDRKFCYLCFPCWLCCCISDTNGDFKWRCSEEFCDNYYCKDCCSAKKCILFFAYVFLIFIASIVFIFTYAKYDDDLNEITYQIEKVLNSKLIYSFKNKTLCDFDEEELVLGTWDGTKVGCHCAGAVYDYECSEELKKQNCITIPAFNKINYTRINSNYICIKKSKFSYKDLLKTEQIVEKGKNCSIDYKSCGLIDTIDRKLCVKITDSCPINRRMIENKDTNKDEIFDELNILNENEYLNSDEEEQIFSIFQLSQKILCINPFETSWDYHYILEKGSKKCESEIDNQKYDNKYEILLNYTTKKYQLYLDNSIMNKLLYLDDISLNIIKNEEVYLFARRLTGLNKNILDNFDYNLLIEKENSSNIANTIMLFCFIGLGGLIVLILLINIVVRFRVNKVGISDCNVECEGLNDDCNENLCKATIIIIVGGAVITFLVLLISIFFIFHTYKSIENMINIEGSDEILYKLLNEEFGNYYINYLFPLLIIIFFSCSPLILLLSPCYC